jgi:hypothetical protein
MLERPSRIKLAWIALSNRARNSDDLRGRLARWRSTLKCVLAVLFLPERGLWGDPASIEIATWNHHQFWGPDGECWDWCYLAVAWGWRDWRWDAGTDGAP